MTGRLMNEPLGKLHFWLTLLAAYGTFFPMHFAGLAGEPRHYSQLAGTTPALQALLPLQTNITYFAFVLAAAQFVFLANLLWSTFRGNRASNNPWQATTMEWALPFGEFSGNFHIPCFSFRHRKQSERFIEGHMNTVFDPMDWTS